MFTVNHNNELFSILVLIDIYLLETSLTSSFSIFPSRTHYFVTLIDTIFFAFKSTATRILINPFLILLFFHLSNIHSPLLVTLIPVPCLLLSLRRLFQDLFLGPGLSSSFLLSSPDCREIWYQLFEFHYMD